MNFLPGYVNIIFTIIGLLVAVILVVFLLGRIAALFKSLFTKRSARDRALAKRMKRQDEEIAEIKNRLAEAEEYIIQLVTAQSELDEPVEVEHTNDTAELE